METTTQVVTTEDQVYWEALGMDEHNNLIIKVFSKEGVQAEGLENILAKAQRQVNAQDERKANTQQALKRVDVLVQKATADEVTTELVKGMEVTKRLWNTEGKEVILKELEEQLTVAYEEAEEFEKLIQTVAEECVYMVPNRRSGRNLRIRWTDNVTSNKGTVSKSERVSVSKKISI